MSNGDITVNLSVSGTVQTSNATPSPPGGVPAPSGGVMPSGPSNTPSVSPSQSPGAAPPSSPSPASPSPGVPSGASSPSGSGKIWDFLSKFWKDESGTVNMSAIFQKLSSGLSSVSSALGGLTVAGAALKLQFDLMVGTAQAVDAWLNQLAVSARRFNGEVAAATAIANVKDLLGDISQSQTLGPDLAQYVSARSDLSATLKRIETALASDIIPTAVEMVNILGSAARGFDRVYGVLSEGTGVRSWLPTVLTTWFQGSTIPGQFVAFFNFLEIIANNTNPVQPPAQPNTPNQDFNNFINNVMQGFQAQQAGNQPFIIP